MLVTPCADLTFGTGSQSIRAPYERYVTFTSHSFLIYTIPSQIVWCDDVHADTMPRPLRERPTKGWVYHCFTENVRTSAADPCHERRSGAQYIGTRVKRPGKQRS